MVRVETPGLLLMGLALIGGGVATTAGGVKLLRVFALYRNGVREMERLGASVVCQQRGRAHDGCKRMARLSRGSSSCFLRSPWR